MYATRSEVSSSNSEELVRRDGGIPLKQMKMSRRRTEKKKERESTEEEQFEEKRNKTRGKAE